MLTELQLELTRLIGKKELTFWCLIEWSGNSSVNKRYLQKIDSQYLMGYGDSEKDMYQEAFWISELFLRDCEIIGHPATLSDFHRWMNEKNSEWKIDVWEQRQYWIWIFGIWSIEYDSSKDLLEQDIEALKQIINLICNNQ